MEDIEDEDMDEELIMGCGGIVGAAMTLAAIDAAR